MLGIIIIPGNSIIMQEGKKPIGILLDTLLVAEGSLPDTLLNHSETGG